MLKTAFGGLPNSTIEASRSGSADNLPSPPTRSVSSMPGTKKISCTKPDPSTMLRELSIRLLPERSGISSRFGPATWTKPGIAAARRGVDAAIRARGRQHAERRHRDEFFRMRVDLRAGLGDHARRWLWVDRRQVAGGKLGHGFSPVEVFGEGNSMMRSRHPAHPPARR